MTTDGYARATLTAVALTLALIAAHRMSGPGSHPAAAARSAEAQTVLTVPRDFGKLVGFLGARAFFEASDGTIRGVNVDGAGAAQLVTIITRK